MAQVTDLNIAQGTLPHDVMLVPSTGSVTAFSDVNLYRIGTNLGTPAAASAAPGDILVSSTNAPLAGCSRLVQNVPGTSQNFISSISSMGTVAGFITLYDRIWQQGGFSATVTTAQNFTIPALPARDLNGQSFGVEYFLGLNITTLTGAGTPTLTLNYTNSDGVSGRVATGVVVGSTTSAVNRTYRFKLQGSDRGVGAGTASITLSATWTAGAFEMFLYRPILTIPVGVSSPYTKDILTNGLLEVFNGASITALYTAAVTTTGALLMANVGQTLLPV